MDPLLIAVIAMIGCAAVYQTYRWAMVPSTAISSEIFKAVMNLQDAALKNGLPSEPRETMTASKGDQAIGQTWLVQDTLRIDYTIKETESGFVHVVSSHFLKRKAAKYQMQCMSIAMVALFQSLSGVGIDPQSVNFCIVQSGGGHFVEMPLTSTMQQKMLSRPKITYH